MNRYIIGSGRSGTTLLRRLLTERAYVFIPHETQFPAYVSAVLAKKLPMEAQARELARVAAVTAQRDWAINEQALSERFVTERCASIDEVVNSFIGHLQAVDRGNSSLPWVIKTPVLLPYQRRLLGEQPNTRVVVVVRDGRAVYNSYEKVHASGSKPFGPKGGVQNALFWADAAARTWDLEEDERTLVIRYEQLVTDPTHTVGQVIEFLDLKERLEPSSEATPLLDRQAGNEHQLVNKQVRAERATAFEGELATGSLLVFEVLAHPWMGRFQYSSSTHPWILRAARPASLLGQFAARQINDYRYQRRIRRVV